MAGAAPEFLEQVGAPLQRNRVELFYEPLLAALLTHEVDGQRQRQDPGEHDRGSQGLVQPFRLEPVVGDPGGKVGGYLFSAAASQAVGNQKGQPGDGGQTRRP